MLWGHGSVRPHKSPFPLTHRFFGGSLCFSGSSGAASGQPAALPPVGRRPEGAPGRTGGPLPATPGSPASSGDLHPSFTALGSRRWWGGPAPRACTKRRGRGRPGEPERGFNPPGGHGHPGGLGALTAAPRPGEKLGQLRNLSATGAAGPQGGITAGWPEGSGCSPRRPPPRRPQLAAPGRGPRGAAVPPLGDSAPEAGRAPGAGTETGAA